MPSLVSRGRGRRTINEINMVPFIDVMLVLLIIFMVTAPLITPSMIDLPSIGKAAKQPDQIIQVILGKTEDILELKINDKTSKLPLKELASAVKAAQNKPAAGGAAANASNSAVIISADKSVKYESVVKVMDTLQRAGIQRVGLSVQMVN
ncbi:biopolymer transporter ExbD [Rhodoferax aquaticus]|uniref:Protein TolR n=1 Tax=Rhodoferax aquaticus TaxID=2527691 RepID=A0A515ENK3_9BURK|nr:biopolymer transporter ExbD [Rhodoferax aquaticus]QDL54225.1 protein TolR [Rhodoferax aquaticus]